MSAESSKKPGIEVIKPNWPVADNIHAFCTTRNIGHANKISRGSYASFNLALHVEDNPAQVEVNRELLKTELSLPAEPVWLDQVHGRQVVNVADVKHLAPEADASISISANKVCAVMTADCLPVLICNRKGNKVAAAHAGWRGLLDGVIESTIESLNEKNSDLLVWLGPAIGPQSFEVGQEVRSAFIENFAQAEETFKENRPGHYLADIYQLARLRLKRIGIESVYGGDYCTYNEANRFYSYRRDGKTGRQASLIWFT